MNHLPRLHPDDMSELIKSITEHSKEVIHETASREHTIAENVVFTAEEISYMLKIEASTIYRLLRKGTIKGFKAGGQWRVTQESYNNYTHGNTK